MDNRPKRTPEDVMKDRIARAKALTPYSKPALLAEISRRARVHGCDMRTLKRDLIAYLVDLELPLPRAPRREWCLTPS